MYEFGNPGLEVFKESDIINVLDGIQQVEFNTKAEELLNLMNMMRTKVETPQLTIKDCLWVRHLGYELNFQNLIICPYDKYATDLI